jgi:Arc/MetJ-type ribon-helix-helix transcriptional regulator
MPRAKTDKVVRTWKASPGYVKLIRNLVAAKVAKSESDAVRAGLVLLAKKNGVKYDV